MRYQLDSMVPTISREMTGQHQSILEAFEAFERAGRETTPAWVRALHSGGIAHFEELGFPTTRHEEWRFINIKPIAQIPWRLPLDPAGAMPPLENLLARLIPDLPGWRMVFVDGRFAPGLSSPSLALPGGALALNLRDAVQRNGLAAGQSVGQTVSQTLGRLARFDQHPFVALNTAFLDDGAALVIPPRLILEEPVYIVYASTGAAGNVFTHPRTVVIAQRESQVKLIEHFVSLGENAGLTNSVTEIQVEEGASVEHCKVQEESAQAHHLATIQTQQARQSRLLSHSISIGGSIVRNNINCALDGEHLEATLNGLYLTGGRQVVDHHTAIFHNKPHGASHEFYHGILDGQSQAVFNGKIFVRPEAQKTDAKQTNRNLLLSNDATINTKPQLEIFADDVKCTHGATIGQMDEQSLFYLRARGIGLENARKMLLHAFASEIVNRITIEPVRARLDTQLFDRYEK